MAHGSGNEVARVKEGNVEADEFVDNYNSMSYSDKDEEGVVWARFGAEAEVDIRRMSI